MVGGVDIDAMVFDRRGKGSGVGEVLVICCEGNAGEFLEGLNEFFDCSCCACSLMTCYLFPQDSTKSVCLEERYLKDTLFWGGIILGLGGLL